MSSIDHVVINVQNIQQAIQNWKNQGFSVYPGDISETSPIQFASIPFQDYSYILLINIKKPINKLTENWNSNREGIVDYGILSLDPTSTSRMIVASGLPFQGPISHLPNTTVTFLPQPHSPFPFLIQDLGTRGQRGIPFGPEYLQHPNGAKGIKVIMIASQNPSAASQIISKMTGIQPQIKNDSASVMIGQVTLKFVMPKKDEGPFSIDILTDKQPTTIDLKLLNYARISLVNAMGYQPGLQSNPQQTIPSNPPKPGAYFFPSEESFQKLLDLLNSSKKSIDLAIFNFSDNQLSQTILNAKQRGCKIRIISDDEQTKNQGNDILKLKQSNIQVKIDNSPYLMHNKFCIVDEEWLETGSFNWTVSARTQNRENILILKDVNIVKSYQEEFDKMWQSFPDWK